LIERAEALGEPLDDPLLLFSVLYGLWVANFVAFNGQVMRELAAQFLALAEKQKATAPLMIGHRLMGTSLWCTGNIVEGRTHYNHALALYDPIEHRLLATRFGQDVAVATLSQRSLASWMLGYPMAALTDAEQAIRSAREVGETATLMYALFWASNIHIVRGNYAKASALVDELVAVADEAGALQWNANGMMTRGWILALTGRPSDTVQTITSALISWRSTGATYWVPLLLSYLARASAELGEFDDAWRNIREAMTTVETTKERWFEAEIDRVAGEIALTEQDAAKAEAYFEHSLTVAREQHAKSFELRATMSMARLWREQGKRDEARDLLALVYGWFTEGFDTVDLKQAKALLDQLS
jgi:predicted ATPase